VREKESLLDFQASLDATDHINNISVEVVGII